MDNKLLIASHNSGKVEEFRRMLELHNIELLSLRDLGITFEAVECGKTFQENSEIKAKVYGNLSGLVTLADDSGLSVDSLNGDPGVRSARYGGDGLSDEDRVQLLLKNMREIPRSERNARFIAVLTLFVPNDKKAHNKLISIAGTCDGVIADKPVGSNGFGYDPIFYVPSLGKTTAQISSLEKDSISHRGKALKKMRIEVQKLYNNNND
ncbi:MAG: non-canonical purine NTP pyrophosphatase, RdgB/HAM1 family [Chloroflexi bacterium]|nr:non-canonical purine NTP pyrophosphatase, RdgB/HAM1 family [Chloroflexota bacterium]